MWKARRTKTVPVERALSFQTGPDDATFERARQGDAAAWADLWTLLCHQGTVHPSSGPALPVLADIAPSVADLECWWEPVQLAGAIVASTDHPFDPARLDLRGPYAESIAALRAAGVRDLARPVDDVRFVYLLKAVAAFDDVAVLQHDLDWIVDGELDIDCFQCGADNVVDFGTVLADDPRLATIRTASPDQLDPGAAAVLALCLENGRPTVATDVRKLLGTITCRSCGRDFTVAEAAG